MADKPAAKRRGAAQPQRRGTLLDSLPRTPAAPRDSAARHRRPISDSAEQSDIVETPGRLTLPSMPRMAAQGRLAPRADASAAQRPPVDSYDIDTPYDQRDATYHDVFGDEYSDEYGEVYQDEYSDEYGYEYGDDSGRALVAYGGAPDDDDGWAYQSRVREHSLARPLTPALPQYNDPEDALVPVYPPLPMDSAPELAAYRPMRAPHRARLDTRALAQTARNPWTIARLILALTAMLLALMHAPGQMGEQTQPLMTAHARAGLAPGNAITSLIQPETQLMRPDLYDNYGQFQEWGGAACSAAAISEVLTAYGVPHATIGREIDELGAYISPNGGLLDRHGFVVVAAKHNLRADESTSLTYNQIIYLSEQLGMPVIVNVHISYGYYHFFDGGHFLVVVGGDAQGLKIVDSSEYYIHYLPKDVFYQMFTGYTAAIVPGDYQYTLPNN